jgi:hypothetical protein
MTDKEVTDSRNSLEMMRRPHLWTHLILPLVKRGSFYDTPLNADEAILWCDIGSTNYAFLANHNMFMPVPEDAKWEKGGDELLVRLVKEGWEVD